MKAKQLQHVLHTKAFVDTESQEFKKNITHPTEQTIGIFCKDAVFGVYGAHTMTLYH